MEPIKILNLCYFFIVFALGVFIIDQHENQHYKLFELYGCENITKTSLSVTADCSENKEIIREKLIEQENYIEMIKAYGVNLIWITLLFVTFF